MKTRFRKVFCDRRKSGKTGKIPGERECFGNGHETDWADLKKRTELEDEQIISKFYRIWFLIKNWAL